MKVNILDEMKDYIASFDIEEDNEELILDIFDDFLLFKNKKIFEFLKNITNKDIGIVNDFFIRIINYSLKNNAYTKRTLNYCIYWSKMLVLLKEHPGLFLHSCGLLYQNCNDYQNALKYFKLALISDVDYFKTTEEVRGSNAFCVICTDIKSLEYGNNFLGSLLIAKLNNKQGYRDMNVFEKYEFLEMCL